MRYSIKFFLPFLFFSQVGFAINWEELTRNSIFSNNSIKTLVGVREYYQTNCSMKVLKQKEGLFWVFINMDHNISAIDKVSSQSVESAFFSKFAGGFVVSSSNFKLQSMSSRLVLTYPYTYTRYANVYTISDVEVTYNSASKRVTSIKSEGATCFFNR